MARRNRAEVVVADEIGVHQGLESILDRLKVSGQPAAQILDFDLSGLLARQGLATNLTMSRLNGLFEMVKRLRSFAAGLAARQPMAPSEELKVAV